MDDQPFAYYQPSQQFNSYPDSQYPSKPYDSEYSAGGDPFVDNTYTGTPVQGEAQGWSTPFPATENTTPFQRRDEVSDGASENARPEVGGGQVRTGRLRLDINFNGNNSESHVQEAGANLASPLDLRSQHSGSAVTSAAYPTSANGYDTPSTSPVYDMNRDRGTSGLPHPHAMAHDPTYFMNVYSNQQLPPPMSASGVYSGTHLPSMARHHQQYAPSRSPQSHLHPLSASPYGSSTPRIGLTIPPYTASSIASSSARSASPASTAATSAQPLDFSSLTSPSGEQELGVVPGRSPTVHSATMMSAGLSHSIDPMGRPDRSSTTSHSVSPIRRRAGKQRLDDARRKEICTYARDRPKARQEDIALKYGVERSTISKILKNKDKWLSVDTHTRKPILVKHSSPVYARPSKFPEIETELLIWVKECQENGTGITDSRIKTKAREYAAQIGLPEGKFKASSGWIENFKVRNNLTRRSQDEQETQLADKEHDDTDHMDEDDDAPLPASQATRAEDGSGYEADPNGEDSFNSFASLSTQPESALAPPEASFSTFSTESVASGSQDLSLFLSGTPMSSNASSFASSPSGAMPQHAPNDVSMRSRGQSHSIAMRAVGSSCTPSGSPLLGASSAQPLSPARPDMRLASTPTSASIPRYPSPLSASTPASASPLVLLHNARHTPVSQNHSRHPSDASGFSYDAPSSLSADASTGFNQQTFHAPTSSQALNALDTVLMFLSQPLAAEIVSHSERVTFETVRLRLAQRMMQVHQQLHPNTANNVGDNQ
ncbi:Tc5 transposase DNA-binding domain protein [Ceratobasidium sp. AG-Ba]|nr:Tc5 transposase DNA-binding domain protein [Ceratobasidium sp. AG-Ba]